MVINSHQIVRNTETKCSRVVAHLYVCNQRLLKQNPRSGRVENHLSTQRFLSWTVLETRFEYLWTISEAPWTRFTIVLFVSSPPRVKVEVFSSLMFAYSTSCLHRECRIFRRIEHTSFVYWFRSGCLHAFIECSRILFDIITALANSPANGAISQELLCCRLS